VFFEHCRRVAADKPQEIKIQSKEEIDSLHQQYEKLESDFHQLGLKIDNLKKHFVESNARKQSKIYSRTKIKE
jgi:cell division protein FtsB